MLRKAVSALVVATLATAVVSTDASARAGFRGGGGFHRAGMHAGGGWRGARASMAPGVAWRGARPGVAWRRGGVGWRGPALAAAGVGVGLGVASAAAWGGPGWSSPGWGWDSGWNSGWNAVGWNGGCTSLRQVWTGWGWRTVAVNSCW